MFTTVMKASDMKCELAIDMQCDSDLIGDF